MAHSHLWQATSVCPEILSLNRALDVDVCVVGAGITGLTLAHALGAAGLSVAAVEADQVMKATAG